MIVGWEYGLYGLTHIPLSGEETLRLKNECILYINISRIILVITADRVVPLFFTIIFLKKFKSSFV